MENRDQSQAMTAGVGSALLGEREAGEEGVASQRRGLAELRPKRRVRAKVCRQREQLVQKLGGEMEHALPGN